MPFPQWLAKANRRFTNPLLIGLTRRPPFAALSHTGRVSDRVHRIPINAFPTSSGFVIACTYGTEADWVRNILAGGGAVLEYGGERIELWKPRLTGLDEAARSISLGFRLLLSVLRVKDYMILERRNPEAA